MRNPAFYIIPKPRMKFAALPYRLISFFVFHCIYNVVVLVSKFFILNFSLYSLSAYIGLCMICLKPRCQVFSCCDSKLYSHI